jgi:hypothetical protein
MLRIIETFCNLPETLEPSKNITCQPGQIGALKISKGKTVVDICDGLHPFGIIDDIKSRNIRAVSTQNDQIHIVPVHHDIDRGTKETFSIEEVMVELKHQHIIAESFVSSISGDLRADEGIYVIPAHTACNYCLSTSVTRVDILSATRFTYTYTGVDTPNAIRFTCAYAFNIPMKEEQDTISTSGKITVWTKNLIAETDMYDTSVDYPKYANLYVNKGYLTTSKVNSQCPAIGIVLGSPHGSNDSMLRFLFDPNGNVDIAVNNS